MVQQHLETWLAQVRAAEPDSEPVSPFVERDFRRYLECGILADGNALMQDLTPYLLHISIEQYLEAELTAPVKHEYVAGHIYAMVGTSKAHNRIAINLTAALNTHLRGGPCQVFMADIKVYVKNATAFYYPDVVVACDGGDGDPYVVTKPLLIVEVLSPSTERIDQEEKLHNYRQLDSLEEYILITPETKEAEVHRRVEGLWKVEAYAGEGKYGSLRWG